MKRALAFVAPALVAITFVAAPLVLGSRTLILRDVLNTHYGLRVSLGEAVRAGELPIIDPLRAGGQPLAGNPNAVPFYPTNLLLLVGTTLWQLNVHFVVHWLVAFAGAFWLGRTWGFGREGAGGVAAAYALSGYWLSQMNLFNAVAPVALAPALWAALIELGEARHRRRASVALGGLWGLALLGGEPIVALVALGSGLVLAAGRHGRRLPWLPLLAALVCGTLLAAPQIVESARILGESYRSFQGYGEARSGVRDPRAIADLLIPLFFGRPDLDGLWGQSLFGGFPPLYFSLFPGLVAVALAISAGRPRSRLSRVTLAFSLAGFVLTFSGGTLLDQLLGALPGGALFRFPEKLFLFAALGFALAVGAGVERIVGDGDTRPFARAAGFLLLPGLGAWLGFGVVGDSAGDAVRALFGATLDTGTYAAERLRWAGLSMFVVVALALALWAALVFRRRPAVAAALLLALHAVSQMFLLAPLLATDESGVYLREPALSAHVPRAAVLAHGGVHDLFGSGYATVRPGELPDRRYFHLERRAHDELYGFAALADGRKGELFVSPEGLDHFVTQALTLGMSGFDDPRRIAVLRAIGVERLILHRPLSPPGAGGAEQVAESIASGRTIRVFALPAPLPAATLAGEVRFAPHVNAALAEVGMGGFDPSATAIVAGSGSARSGPRGTTRTILDTREAVELEVDSERGGFLVLRRSYLPIWSAVIDGRPAPTVVAQITRLAVEVPPGRHRVRFSISRAPLRAAVVLSLLGLLGLLGLARGDRSSGGNGPPGRGGSFLSHSSAPR